MGPPPPTELSIGIDVASGIEVGIESGTSVVMRVQDGSDPFEAIRV